MKKQKYEFESENGCIPKGSIDIRSASNRFFINQCLHFGILLDNSLNGLLQNIKRVPNLETHFLLSLEL